MSGSIITPLAELLAEKVKAVGGKPYVWAPAELSSLPAGVVELPSITRVGVDEPEDHLGQKDWTLTYPVVFYFDLSKADTSQAKAADLIEAFIGEIDDDQSLEGNCQEAKVVAVEEPEFLEDKPKPQIRWMARVEVLKFV